MPTKQCHLDKAVDVARGG